MQNLFIRFYVATRDLVEREDARDLVEYGLAVALIACVCVAGMHTFATAVTGIFSRINKHLF